MQYFGTHCEASFSKLMQTKWFDEELNLEFNRNIQARLPRKTAWPTEVWRDNLPRCSLSSADPEPWFLQYSVSILSRFWKYNCPRCLSPYFAFPASNQHRTTSLTNVKSIKMNSQQSDEFFWPRSVSLFSWDSYVSPDLFSSSRDVLRKHVSSCPE